MQKKLLTMAVAGALAVPGLALAQSSVEVYGTINMAFGHWKFDDAPGGIAGTSKFDVANGASNYGLRGRESLGGGLTAWFQIEQNAPLERSTNQAIRPASRNSAVGIQGAWGNVFIGQWTTPWADLDALWSVGTVGFWGPVTTVIGRRETTGTSPNANVGTAANPNELESVGGVGHPFWRRVSQSIFYQSPVWSGFQGKLAIQTNDTKSEALGSAAAVQSNASLWSASVQWAGMGGNARIGVAYDHHKDHTTVGGTDTGWAIKGGYNFGIVDIGLAYETMTYECSTSNGGIFVNQGAAWNGMVGSCVATGDVKAKNWAIAAAVPIGTGAIRGSYARAKALDNIGITNATGPNTGSKVWNIGYEHRFSKRTNVGIGYAKIDNDADSANSWTGMPPNAGGVTPGNTLGQDSRTVFMSITHRF